ncbi:unnamed protein product, partial [Didymodactylos carnosus]
MLGDTSSNAHMQYLRDGGTLNEAEESKLNQPSFNKEESDYPMRAVTDWTESRDNLHEAQQFDNEQITKPKHGGFLVSFLVDARGGAMRGCRHSGVRVIIPPKRASMPTRITCRFVKREKLTIPPPLNEGEALAARVLEVGPVACKFLGPVILEIPHFASLRGREREIVVLRSDNGEKWTEHPGSMTDEAVKEALGETIDMEELDNVEDLHSKRITRIITNDFPRYFALVTRVRQESNFIDDKGGVLNSTVVSHVEAVIPEKALQKRIRVSLHVLPISHQIVHRSYGTRVNVSPVVTVEPRRRKFHKPITLTIPLPKSSTTTSSSSKHQQSGAYSSDSQTLRLLCSITGGTHAAQFDDITGHTPVTFSNDCATFTTTVSARFWLIDAQGVQDVIKMAHDIYREATSVPYMSRFVVFAKRHDLNEAMVRVFCVTDDKENKTLEMQEHFTEIAKSKEVEVLNGNSIYVDVGGNLNAVVKTSDQLIITFRSFRENRLPFVVRIRDPHQEANGRMSFYKDNLQTTSGTTATIQKSTSATLTNGNIIVNGQNVVDTQALQAICNLNISIPSYDKDFLENEERLHAMHSMTISDGHADSRSDADMYRKGEIRLTDIAKHLGQDWPALAAELELSEEEVTQIMDQHGENAALHMLRYWLKSRGPEATGNCLQQALRKIGKENIVHSCVFNIEWVTDAAEKEVAKARLTSRGGESHGRRTDEGFESDDEYERKRQEKYSKSRQDKYTLVRFYIFPVREDGIDDNTIKITDIISTKPSTTTTTIIKTITLEETEEDGEKIELRQPIKIAKETAITISQPVVPQFKQFEPLKVKFPSRDHSKEFTSSSSSSADTIVTVGMRGDHYDDHLHYVDSSKATTPASRYGGYYSIYHGGGAYSGSITPSSCHSTAFEMMHIESLREKLNRLTRESQNLTSGRADLDDTYGSPRVLRGKDDGKTTPTSLSSEFQKKTLSREASRHQPGDYSIVNIVKEFPVIAGITNENDRSSVHVYANGRRTNDNDMAATTNGTMTYDKPNNNIANSSGIMETIIQNTFVSPSKIDFNKLNDQPQQEQLDDQPDAVIQLAQGARQTLDDIREYLPPDSFIITNNVVSKRDSTNTDTQSTESSSSPISPLEQFILPEEKSVSRTSNVAERLSKSKIIPEPARALANALKHAVVKPLKKTMNKMRSFDSTTTSSINNNELSSVDTQKVSQETVSESTGIELQHHPSIVYPPPHTSPSIDDEKHSDIIKSTIVSTEEHTLSEPSTPVTTFLDSVTLSSLLLTDLPPTNPPQHRDSSSSADVLTPLLSATPPVKPPRKFIPHDDLIFNSNNNDESLLDNYNLIQQTDDVVKKVLNIVDTFGMPDNGIDDVELLKYSHPPQFVYIQQPSNKSELISHSNNVDNEQKTHTNNLEQILSDIETGIHPYNQEIVTHDEQFKSDDSDNVDVKYLSDIMKHIREASRQINHSDTVYELRPETYEPLSRTSVVLSLIKSNDVHRFEAAPRYIALMSDKLPEQIDLIPDQPNFKTVIDLSTATSLALEPQQNVTTEFLNSPIDDENDHSMIEILGEQNELETALCSHIINPLVGPISSQQTSSNEVDKSLLSSDSSPSSNVITVISSTFDTNEPSPIQTSVDTLSIPYFHTTTTTTIDTPLFIEETAVQSTSVTSSIDSTSEPSDTVKNATLNPHYSLSEIKAKSKSSNDTDIQSHSVETAMNIEKIAAEIQQTFDEENQTQSDVDKIRDIDTMINKDRQSLLAKLSKLDNSNPLSRESSITTTLTSSSTPRDSISDQAGYASESSGGMITFLDSFKTGLNIQEQPLTITEIEQPKPSIASTSRPLMFVSLDSGFNLSKVFSPLTDFVKTSNTDAKNVQRPSIPPTSPIYFCPPPTLSNTTPLITTTSVTVISRADPMVNSILTTSSTNDDDLILKNGNSSLMPYSLDAGSDNYNHRSLRSKENSIDSVDANFYDNVQQIRSGTPRSLISDYDNLHGSFVSLNDSQTIEGEQQQQQQQQQTQLLSSSLHEMVSSPSIISKNDTSSILSGSTQYESFDNIPTTTSSLSTVYQSALSTLNNSSNDFSDITLTPEIHQIPSEISDNDIDLVENINLKMPTSSLVTNINQISDENNATAATLSKHIVEDNMDTRTKPSATLPVISPIQSISGLNKTSVSFQRLSKYTRPADELGQHSSDINTILSSISTVPSYTSSPNTIREIRSKLMEISPDLSKKTSKIASSNVSSHHQQPVSSTADHIQSNWLEDRRAYQSEEQQQQQQILPKTRSPRMSPPTKLSFEQNITNLEKESPLLQSELLTAEHELSALKSRLAVTEGITAVTSTILESLKEHFELPAKQVEQIDAAIFSTRENVDTISGRKVCGDLSSEPIPKIASFNKILVSGVSSHSISTLKPTFIDQATSPIQEFNINNLPMILTLPSLTVASQTSPMIENISLLPSLTNELTGESVEIHYDAITNQQTSFLVKTRNSFWIANHIPIHEAENRLRTMSSPVMKRATVKLPESMDQFLSDSEDEFSSQTHKKTAQQVDEEKLPKESLDIDRESQWSIESIADSEKLTDPSISNTQEFVLSTKDEDEIIGEYEHPSVSQSQTRSPFTEQNLNLFNEESMEIKQSSNEDTGLAEVLAPSISISSAQELLTLEENGYLSTYPPSDLEHQASEFNSYEKDQFQPTQVVDESTVFSKDKLIQQDSLTQLYENISASITDKVLSDILEKQQQSPKTSIESESFSQSPPLPITPDRETSYDTKEQLSEMIKIRSAPSENRQQLEELEVKVEELDNILDHMLHQQDKEISTEMNEFELKVDELTTIVHDIDMKKQNEDRIESEIDELYKIILSIHGKNQINFDILPNSEKDYELTTEQLSQERRHSLELLKENVDELRQIIYDISTINLHERPHNLLLTTDNQILQSHNVTTSDVEVSDRDLSEENENKITSVRNIDIAKEWTPEQMAEYFQCTSDGKPLSNFKLSSEDLPSTFISNKTQPIVDHINQQSYSLDNLTRIIDEMRESQHIDIQKLIPEDSIVSTTNRSSYPEKKVITHLIPESPRISSDVFYEGGRNHSLFDNTHNLINIVQTIIDIGQQQKSVIPHLIPEAPRITQDVFYEGDTHRTLYTTDIDDLRTIVEDTSHKVQLEPEEPRITADVFYEGDTQRSLYQKDNEQSNNGGLYQIVSDIHDHSLKKALESDTEEVLAESFITTEMPVNKGGGLYEIIHEIENFPLRSNTTSKQFYEDDEQQMSPDTMEFMNTIQEVERHSIHDENIMMPKREYRSPFSQEPSIVIHRTILTRNDTLYEPEKLTVDSGLSSPTVEIESQSTETFISKPVDGYVKTVDTDSLRAVSSKENLYIESSAENPYYVPPGVRTLRREDIDQLNEDDVKPSNGLHQIIDDIHNINKNKKLTHDDWTTSPHQRQEIYGEKYRPERKFSSDLVTHKNIVSDDSFDTADHFIKNVQEQPPTSSDTVINPPHSHEMQEVSPTQGMSELTPSVEELIKIASSLRNFQKPVLQDQESSQILSYKTDEYSSSDEEIDLSKRPDNWTNSSFQRQEIYGDKYRPEKYLSEDQIDYAMESPEVEIRLAQETFPTTSGLESIIRDISNDNTVNEENQDSSFVSHIQRSSIISRTIPSTRQSSDEISEDSDNDQILEDNQLYTSENDFRPTHLNITTSSTLENQSAPFQSDFPVLSTESIQQFSTEQQKRDSSEILVEKSKNDNDDVEEEELSVYDRLLIQTSADIVNKILQNAINEEFDYDSLADNLNSSKIETLTEHSLEQFHETNTQTIENDQIQNTPKDVAQGFISMSSTRDDENLPQLTMLNYKMQQGYNLNEAARHQQQLDNVEDEQDSLNDSSKYSTSADALPLDSSLDSIAHANEEEQQITDWNSLVKGTSEQERQVHDIPELVISEVSVENEQEDDLEDQQHYISSNSVQDLGNLINELQELEEKLEEEHLQEEQETSLSSIEDEDDESKNLIPHPTDEPYLSVSDVVTSRSTQELGDLVSELKSLEKQINETIIQDEENDRLSSEEDEIHPYDLQISQSLSSTKSTQELGHLVEQLHKVEEQLENKLEQSASLQLEPSKLETSKSSNELVNLMSELTDVAHKLEIKLNYEQFSNDIIEKRRNSKSISDQDYHRTERRPSSPPTTPTLKTQFVEELIRSMNDVDEAKEELSSLIANQDETISAESDILQEMIENIIKQAQETVENEEKELNLIQSNKIIDKNLIKSPNTILEPIDRRRPYTQSSATSISDELSTEDNTIDKQGELAAQLDYLRRMSRYESLYDEDQRQQHNASLSETSDMFEQQTKFGDYLTAVREEELETKCMEDEDGNKTDSDKNSSNEDDDNKQNKYRINNDKPFFERKDKDEHDDSDDDGGNRTGDQFFQSNQITDTNQISEQPQQQQSSEQQSGSSNTTQVDNESQMQISQDSIENFNYTSSNTKEIADYRYDTTWNKSDANQEETRHDFVNLLLNDNGEVDKTPTQQTPSNDQNNIIDFQRIEQNPPDMKTSTDSLENESDGKSDSELKLAFSLPLDINRDDEFDVTQDDVQIEMDNLFNPISPSSNNEFDLLRRETDEPTPSKMSGYHSDYFRPDSVTSHSERHSTPREMLKNDQRITPEIRRYSIGSEQSFDEATDNFITAHDQLTTTTNLTNEIGHNLAHSDNEIKIEEKPTVYHMIQREIETEQLPVMHARRTISENSLYSTSSSSVPMNNSNSLSNSCLQLTSYISDNEMNQSLNDEKKIDTISTDSHSLRSINNSKLSTKSSLITNDALTPVNNLNIIHTLLEGEESLNVAPKSCRISIDEQPKSKTEDDNEQQRPSTIDIPFDSIGERETSSTNTSTPSVCTIVENSEIKQISLPSDISHQSSLSRRLFISSDNYYTPYVTIQIENQEISSPAEEQGTEITSWTSPVNDNIQRDDIYTTEEFDTKKPVELLENTTGKGRRTSSDNERDRSDKNTPPPSGSLASQPLSPVVSLTSSKKNTAHEELEHGDPLINLSIFKMQSNVQHFPSADDLRHDEKTKLVRSPEIYHMDNIGTNLSSADPRHLSNTQSESNIDDAATFLDIHELSTLSKENSSESILHDAVEKESSPEAADMSFRDVYEPTSSSMRPLALSVPGQAIIAATVSEETIMNEDEFEQLTEQYVNNVLNAVVVQLMSEQTGIIHERILSSTSSSSDISDEQMPLNAMEKGGEESIESGDPSGAQGQYSMTTDSSSFSVQYSADQSHESGSDEPSFPEKFKQPVKTLRRAHTDSDGFQTLESQKEKNDIEQVLSRHSIDDRTGVFVRSSSLQQTYSSENTNYLNQMLIDQKLVDNTSCSTSNQPEDGTHISDYPTAAESMQSSTRVNQRNSLSDGSSYSEPKGRIEQIFLKIPQNDDTIRSDSSRSGYVTADETRSDQSSKRISDENQDEETNNGLINFGYESDDVEKDNTFLQSTAVTVDSLFQPGLDLDNDFKSRISDEEEAGHLKYEGEGEESSTSFTGSGRKPLGNINGNEIRSSSTAERHPYEPSKSVSFKLDSSEQHVPIQHRSPRASVTIKHQESLESPTKEKNTIKSLQDFIVGKNLEELGQCLEIVDKSSQNFNDYCSPKIHLSPQLSREKSNNISSSDNEQITNVVSDDGKLFITKSVYSDYEAYEAGSESDRDDKRKRPSLKSTTDFWLNIEKNEPILEQSDKLLNSPLTAMVTSSCTSESSESCQQVEATYDTDTGHITSFSVDDEGQVKIIEKSLLGLTEDENIIQQESEQNNNENQMSSIIREELSQLKTDACTESSSIVDKIKLKLERSIDRLVKKTLDGEEDTRKSDLISPFTDRSLDAFEEKKYEEQHLKHALSEQYIQVSSDEFDYGTLQRFSSDSCIIIRVPEEYAPSSTLLLDDMEQTKADLKNNQLNVLQSISDDDEINMAKDFMQSSVIYRSNTKNDDNEEQSDSNQESAFHIYEKPEEGEPFLIMSSSPVLVEKDKLQVIDKRPLHSSPDTPFSTDSSIELAERDITEVNDEFVLVKHLSIDPVGTDELSPAASPQQKFTVISKHTPTHSSSSSSSSSDKQESSPDLLEILKHEYDYPPLDTGFDIRQATALETVYESPELKSEDATIDSPSTSDSHRKTSSTSENSAIIVTVEDVMDNDQQQVQYRNKTMLNNPTTSSSFEELKRLTTPPTVTAVDRHSTPSTANTDDSLLEFERLEMEMSKSGTASPGNNNRSHTDRIVSAVPSQQMINTAREIRNSVESLITPIDNIQLEAEKVASYIQRHQALFSTSNYSGSDDDNSNNILLQRSLSNDSPSFSNTKQVKYFPTVEGLNNVDDDVKYLIDEILFKTEQVHLERTKPIEIENSDLTASYSESGPSSCTDQTVIFNTTSSKRNSGGESILSDEEKQTEFEEENEYVKIDYDDLKQELKSNNKRSETDDSTQLISSLVSSIIDDDLDNEIDNKKQKNLDNDEILSGDISLSMSGSEQSVDREMKTSFAGIDEDSDAFLMSTSQTSSQQDNSIHNPIMTASTSTTSFPRMIIEQKSPDIASTPLRDIQEHLQVSGRAFADDSQTSSMTTSSSLSEHGGEDMNTKSLPLQAREKKKRRRGNDKQSDIKNRNLSSSESDYESGTTPVLISPTIEQPSQLKSEIDLTPCISSQFTHGEDRVFFDTDESIKQKQPKINDSSTSLSKTSPPSSTRRSPPPSGQISTSRTTSSSSSASSYSSSNQTVIQRVLPAEIHLSSFKRNHEPSHSSSTSPPDHLPFIPPFVHSHSPTSTSSHTVVHKNDRLILTDISPSIATTSTINTTSTTKPFTTSSFVTVSSPSLFLSSAGIDNNNFNDRSNKTISLESELATHHQKYHSHPGTVTGGFSLPPNNTKEGIDITNRNQEHSNSNLLSSRHSSSTSPTGSMSGHLHHSDDCYCGSGTINTSSHRQTSSNLQSGK